MVLTFNLHSGSIELLIENLHSLKRSENMQRAELKNAIKKSGYRMDFLAKSLGLSYQGFYNKLNAESDFKISEIKCLCDLLKLNNLEMCKIFFDKEVD